MSIQPIDYFENTSTIYSSLSINVLSPDNFENDNVVNSLSLIPSPNYIDNGVVFFNPKIGIATKTVSPDFIGGTSLTYSPSEKIKLKLNFIQSTGVTYNPSTLSNREAFPSLIESTVFIGKPIAKVLPYSPPKETPDAIPRPVGTLPVGERTTNGNAKTFKDLSLMFRPHPVTGDVTRVFDYDSVTQALKLIIYTEFFERPFSSQTIAGGIRSRLFEINDNISRREIQERISQTILKHEPRVIVQNISVKSADNPNAVNVSVTYKIRTFERSETFTMFLERV